jgi:hypothetical protein
MAAIGKLFGGLAAKKAVSQASRETVEQAFNQTTKQTVSKASKEGAEEVAKKATSKGLGLPKNIATSQTIDNADLSSTAKLGLSETSEEASKKLAKEAGDEVAKKVADADELIKAGFSKTQADNIIKSGLSKDEALKLQAAGVKFAPKTFGEILKSPTTMVNAGISVLLGGYVSYKGAQMGEESAQAQAGASSSAGYDPASYGGNIYGTSGYY